MIELEGMPAMKYMKLEIPVSPLTLEVAERVVKLTGNTVQNELRFAAMLGADNRIRENLLFVERMMREAKGDTTHTMRQEVSTDDCVRAEDNERDRAHP